MKINQNAGDQFSVADQGETSHAVDNVLVLRATHSLLPLMPLVGGIFPSTSLYFELEGWS
jgi:hypothetical protein